MATKSGELREMLMSVIDSVREGKVEPDDANAIAKLAAQINQSLKIEIDARTDDAAMGKVALGSMPIGEQQ
jgi:hypothetical protein